MHDLQLTIFYTVALRGELRVLPYLFTLIKDQKAITPGYCVLVDLGESCRMDWPLCRHTEGRALLVALDAMGYDAFNLMRSDPLARDPNTLIKLRDTVITPALLLGENQLLTKKPTYFSDPTGEGARAQFRLHNGLPPELPAEEGVIQIALQQGVPLSSRVEDSCLILEDTRESRIPELGKVVLHVEKGALSLVSQERLAIPVGSRPDASISSVVELVESEASQSAEKRHMGKNNTR